MASIPSTMRSLVAPKPCSPTAYEVVTLPVPEIQHPNEVLIRIHAATINTGDTQFAAGFPRWLGVLLTYPMKIGIQGAGVVEAVGSEVTKFKPSEAVYGIYFTRPAMPPRAPGFCSEYVVIPENLLLAKPSHLSFEEAACLSGSTVTAVQCFKRGLQLMGAESLEGKRVLVPAGLGSTGSVGCQVAKNVYGAERVITSVSTPKVPLVAQHLGDGVVDQVVDYKTGGLKNIEPGSVDFVYSTQWDTATYIPMVKPDKGVIISIASVPSPALLREVLGNKYMPFWIVWLTTLAQLWYKWKLSGSERQMEFISGNPGVREDLELAGEWIATGKVKALMTVVKLDDIESVRKKCEMVATGKGGFGMLVIKIV